MARDRDAFGQPLAGMSLTGPALRAGTPTGFVVALLGAESTGKSTLADELAEALHQEGLDCAVVKEYLRTFCHQMGRTPRVEEQAAIAEEQTRQIGAAAATHSLVVADTTALMTAVYSDLVFSDTALYASAIAAHRHADLTLLMAVDLPWAADGLQRDGPQVRTPVDRRLRAALQGAGMDYQIISGSGRARGERAAAAVRQALRLRTFRAPDDSPRRAATPPCPATLQAWRHLCGRCGDPGCERLLFALRPDRCPGWADGLRSAEPTSSARRP
jgi:nicotinamide riboside kinase